MGEWETLADIVNRALKFLTLRYLLNATNIINYRVGGKLIIPKL